MNSYLFDVKMLASLRVEAASEAEARRMVMAIDANSGNLGAWPNGDPILCEISAHEAELIDDDDDEGL